MITLNKTYAFERDYNCWALRTTAPGVDKDGNPKDHIHTTYHATFPQIARAILERCAMEAENIEELLEAFNNAEDVITKHITAIK
tara:strand:+ start:241 stop:495 length:255 start_codon:yes stop_codon:yes gene_type:complete